MRSRFAQLGMFSFFAMGVAVMFAGASPARASILFADNQDAVIRDNDGDEEGNSVTNEAAGSFFTGELATPADIDEGRAWVPFSPTTAQRDAIASASSVKLNIRLAGKSNVTGFHVDLMGLPNQTSVTADSSDYQATAQLLENQFVTPSTTTGTIYTADVTTFAKAQAALGANSIIAFRLQMDPDTLPNSDGTRNQYRFNASKGTKNASIDPNLEIIPEPTSGALVLSGLGLLLGFGPRRSRH